MINKSCGIGHKTLFIRSESVVVKHLTKGSIAGVGERKGERETARARERRTKKIVRETDQKERERE